MHSQTIDLVRFVSNVLHLVSEDIQISGVMIARLHTPRPCAELSMDVMQRMLDSIHIGVNHLNRILEFMELLSVLIEHTRVELDLHLEARYGSSPDIAAS